MDKYEKTLNDMVDALAEIDTVADPNLTTQPVSLNASASEGIDSRGASQIKVQDSLRPFLLTKEHKPRELYSWQKQFRSFYSVSKLNELDTIGQQSFFFRFIDPSITSVLESKISTTTPIFDDPLRPGSDSCFSLLEADFMMKYPLVSCAGVNVFT